MDTIFTRKSNWIWTPDWDEQDQSEAVFVYFRKELLLQDKPERAIIKVSADSRYRLFINGISVALGPCKGDGEIWHYEEVDIAAYLQAGANVLAAIVLRYPPIQGRGNQSVWRTYMPGFYLVGTLDFTEGGQLDICSDASWKTYKCRHLSVHPETGHMNYLWVFEDAQGMAAAAWWKDAEYDTRDWKDAAAYKTLEVKAGISPGNLTRRPIPMMFEAERSFDEVVCLRQSSIDAADWNKMLKDGQSIQIGPNRQEIIEISAGELTTGFLQMKFSGGKGSEVKIITAEAYVYPEAGVTGLQHGIRKGDRADWKNGTLLGYEDSYRVDGYGTPQKPEYYEPFWFRTFRFIRLEISTGEEALTIELFNYRETGYPLQVQTQVETSDPSLGAIWDMSLRTLRRCMHESYEDCPFYEQLQYAMDTRSQILYTYSVSADDRLARKAIDEFHRSLRHDGTINCCYPSYEPNIIPGFSLYYFLMIYDHMMYFGDRELVKRYMPTVEAIFGFFSRAVDELGLVGKIGGPLFEEKYWSFIDWTAQWNETLGVPGATKTGAITMESLLYATVLGCAGRMAEFIGRDELAGDYRRQAERIKAAVRQYCRGENGYFQDGPGFDGYSQHSQVWAVLSETVVGDEAKVLMKKALSDPTLAKCSVAMAYYLFRAVEMTGLYEETQVLWEPWREMLRQNLTTCVEDPVTARSDCHAWGSLILYELPSVVLGVRPAKPGFEAVEIRPVAGYLDWAKGDVITPKGLISVFWEKVEGELQVQYSVPEGMTVQT